MFTLIISLSEANDFILYWKSLYCAHNHLSVTRMGQIWHIVTSISLRFCNGVVFRTSVTHMANQSDWDIHTQHSKRYNLAM